MTVRTVSVSLAFLVLAASNASAAKLAGSATYRERVALTPYAVFEATLQDVPAAGAQATVIAHMRKSNPGQVPIAFEIEYDPHLLVSDKAYVVRASIYEAGQLRFTGDQAFRAPAVVGQTASVSILMHAPGAGGAAGGNVSNKAAVGLPATFAGQLPCADCAGIRYQINLLSGGAYMQRMTYMREGHDDSYYELGRWSASSDGRTLTLSPVREGKAAYWAVTDARTLRKLDREGKPIESKLPYELKRAEGLRPMELRMTMSGMFRSMADAPRFRECRSGIQWPVTMSEDYKALEKAYTEHRPAPGAELFVSLAGRVEQRPKADGGGGEPTLVVERFVKAMPGENCEGKIGAGEIANNRWRPVRIGEKSVVVSRQEKEPWIELDAKTKQVTGSGGCNRISGSYESGDGTLRFGRLATTMMACPSMETETAFLKALHATRRYKLDGRNLELMDEKGKVLARLEERNL